MKKPGVKGFFRWNFREVPDYNSAFLNLESRAVELYRGRYRRCAVSADFPLAMLPQLEKPLSTEQYGIRI